MKMTNGRNISILDELKGRNLSAVTFVQDYLQLQFDGPLLNVFVWPRIITPTMTGNFGMPDYRDGLCAQIGKPVGDVVAETDVTFRLFFTDGSIIEVSLLPGSRQGPEAVVFQDGKGGFAVW